MDSDIAKTTRMGQVFSNNMQGTMAAATAEAMKSAAKNENGAMAGFMGMGMSQMQGMNMMGAVNGMPQGNVNSAELNQQQAPMPGSIFGNTTQVNNQSNVQTNNAKTCVNCGQPVNGKFCSECGTAAVSEEPKKCPNCGSEPNPGAKFCTQCGQSLL